MRGDIISLIFRYEPVTAVYGCGENLLAHDPVAEIIISQPTPLVKLAICTIFAIKIRANKYNVNFFRQNSRLFVQKQQRCFGGKFNRQILHIKTPPPSATARRRRNEAHLRMKHACGV